MRYFYVFDRIAKSSKKFGTISEAKHEAERIMKIYLRLNNRVKMRKVNDNFYIELERS